MSQKPWSSSPRTPVDFARYIEPDFSLFCDPSLRPSDARHHLEFINEKLLEVLSGRLKRLGISIPPAYGKSTLTTMALPLMYLWLFRDKKVAVVSYNPKLAADFSDKIRIAVEANPQLGIRFRDDSQARDRMLIQGHKGALYSFGINQGITGRHFDLIIIDDPFKSQLESGSTIYRDQVWNTYLSSVKTRLLPGGSVVVIQTRWHEDDLLGRIQLLNQPGWEFITLRAIADADDPLGRQPGEALWPERYSLESLEETRSECERTGASGLFEALYQQNPTAGNVNREWDQKYFHEGIFFSDWKDAGELLHVGSTCDPSKGRTAGDFSATVWGGYDRKKVLWVDANIERMDSSALTNLLVELCKGRFRGFAKPEGLVIESNGFQELIARQVNDRLVKSKGLWNVYCWNNTEGGGKIKARIRRLTGLITSGRLRVKDTLGGRLLVHMLKEWPTGKHDDGPDALELLLRFFNWQLSGKKKPAPTPKRYVS